MILTWLQPELRLDATADRAFWLHVEERIIQGSSVASCIKKRAERGSRTADRLLITLLLHLLDHLWDATECVHRSAD